ncbi:MAG: endolytic transglycosylase MltG [Longimicrobiales bacterium]
MSLVGCGRSVLLALGLVGLVACGGGSGDGPPVTVTVPSGASLGQVADSLSARGVIGARRAFVLFARIRGDDTRVKSGVYDLPRGASWGRVLDLLTAGRVSTVAMTIPEGFRLAQIAPRIAEVTETTPDSVEALLRAASADTFGVPGPGLEGYLFPDTYRFAPGISPSSVVGTLVERHRAFWTPERRARLDSLDMTQQELVTLASIVQAEARMIDEMPTISSVYHNRLRDGWLLQADPTVLYALGGPRPRLLFAAIDSVQDSPYNTYTQPGLPPGPIGSPGAAALLAALYPAPEDFYYFVARPDGSHVFTRTLAEHNRAVADARRARDSVARNGGGPDTP